MADEEFDSAEYIGELALLDDDKCVVTVWSHRGEASYHFETTGSKELEALIKRVLDSPSHDISSINPLNDGVDFGTGFELGGEMW